MGLEAALVDKAPSVNEEEAPLSSADALVHFDTFRTAFRAWQKAGDALDWIRRNEHAVTFLAASNVLPSHFQLAKERSPQRVVELVVRSACCGTSAPLSDAEQITLAELPRIFPFRHSTSSAVPTTNGTTAGASCRTCESLSAQLTVLERQARVMDGLVSRLHRCTCIWRDSVPPPPAAAGVRRDVAPCGVRQLLLGGPSLQLTDATLVRAFCAAVSLNAVGSKESSSATATTTTRGRCLLPRGTPPSVVRQWMTDTVQVLAPFALSAQDGNSGNRDLSQTSQDEWRSGGGSDSDRTLPRLRYEGSNMNDRILRLFFTPRKRQRQDGAATAADGAVTGDVVLDYMSLLMGLYGYSAEAADADTTTGAGNEDEDGGAAATAQTSCEASPAAWWDGPPVVLSAQDTQDGNESRRVETVRRQRTFSAAEAVRLLGRSIQCRYCAHTPWTSVVQEDVTTTTTTTTKTMVVTTTADSVSWPRDEDEAGGKSPTPHLAEGHSAQSSLSSRHSGSFQKGASEQGNAEVEDGSDVARVKEETAENDSGDGEAPEISSSPSARVSEECDIAEGAKENVRASTPLDTASERHLQDEEKASPVGAGAAEQAEESESPPTSAPAAHQQPTHASITTVTRAVTTTSTTTTTNSTTHITVTFSSRTAAPYEPGHAACCPWHRLFVKDAIDTTALATAERNMDFTWVVESEAEAPLSGEAEDEEAGDFIREEEEAVELVVSGEAVPLSEGQEGKEESAIAHGPMDANAEADVGATNNNSDDTSCTEAVTHRTILTLRFFLSEVERLITTWRLSEEWEKVRPSQYLQHPLWRTWSTAGVLHPIHVKAGDGQMEKQLRTLERRMMATAGPISEEDEAAPHLSATCAETLRACIASDRALLSTLGAPLSSSCGASAGTTVERALKLAEASVKRLGDHQGETHATAAAAASHGSGAGRGDTSGALSMLKSGLRTLLEGVRADATAGSESSSGTSEASSATPSPSSRDGPAADAFLAETQRRYTGAVTAVEHSPLLGFCSALRHDAVPRVLSAFTASHYSTVRLAEPALSHAATSSSVPPFTVEPASAALASATPAATSTASPHGMTSDDRAAVAKFLEEMRQTVQAEQLELQREQEREAARVAAVAAAAAAAAAASKAREQAAQASLAAQQNAASTASPQRNQPSHNMSVPPPKSAQQKSVPAGSFHQGGNAAASNQQNRGGDRYGSHGPPQQQHQQHQQQQQQSAPWTAGLGFGGGAAAASPPPPVLASFQSPTTHVFAAPSSILGPQGGSGVNVNTNNSSTAVMGDSGGILPAPSPFSWSPLAYESEGVVSGGGGGDSILGFQRTQQSFTGPNASSPQPPPVFAGGFHNSGSGGRLSDGRPARGPFSSGSVLSSTGGGGGSMGEEVRLSNWSVASNPTHTSAGGVLPSPAASTAPNSFARNSSSSGHAAPGGEAAQRTALQPAMGGGRGGAMHVPAPRRGGGGGDGPRSGPQGNAPISGTSAGAGSSNSSSPGPHHANPAAVLSGGASGGGRGGRGRGRGGPLWRGGGGGGGGRGIHRRGG